MFDLRRPCVQCPFRRSQGRAFNIHPDRLREFASAPAFQCHKTVDYSETEETDDGRERPSSGDAPQQCAGLMAMLHQMGEPNQIMQVAQRMTGFDAGKIDARDVYSNLDEAIAGHAG